MGRLARPDPSRAVRGCPKPRAAGGPIFPGRRAPVQPRARRRGRRAPARRTMAAARCGEWTSRSPAADERENSLADEVGQEGVVVDALS